jgi:galactofuranosylgalactofuranosylrhamnosyl-N-acetylglucosaminyl-diphospho-decaprenol beta-1,5/1,6-galactofuranosyltransferase
VPHVFLQWWRLAQVDSAVVSAADGASASWYQRDPELFRSLLRRSMLLHARLWSEWSELSETYRAAVPELASPQAWRRTIADNAAD